MQIMPCFFKTNIGSSLRTQLPPWKIMDKRFDKSQINASQVTDITFKGENNKPFWLLTQSQGNDLKA